MIVELKEEQPGQIALDSNQDWVVPRCKTYTAYTGYSRAYPDTATHYRDVSEDRHGPIRPINEIELEEPNSWSWDGRTKQKEPRTWNAM